MRLYLVHHGDAVGPDVDIRRPLSATGQTLTARIADAAAARGAKPTVVWHSGKLRAKQTAQAFWRICNPLAEFTATRHLQPDDPPAWIRDRLRFESRDILIAGHFPHLPRLLALLRDGDEHIEALFPPHGIVALRTDDEGETWLEEWRISPVEAH